MRQKRVESTFVLSCDLLKMLLIGAQAKHYLKWEPLERLGRSLVWKVPVTFESNAKSGEGERPMEVRREEKVCGNWKTTKGWQELGPSGGPWRGEDEG